MPANVSGNEDYSYCSLVERYEQTRVRNEKPIMAAVAHVCKDLDAPLLARDPFQFALVLGVWLLYLYTRRLPTVVAFIVVFYMVEFVLFGVLQLAWHKTSAALRNRYSRSNARISDPLIMLFSLVAVHGAIEFTIFGRSGAGLDYSRTEAQDASPLWRALLVCTGTLLVGIVPRRRNLAAFACAVLAFIVWLVDKSGTGAQADLAAWTFLRALALIGFALLAMLVPLGPHFIENSWFANVVLLFVACAATFGFSTDY